MTTVEHLVLSEIDDDELEALVASRYLISLRDLRLRSCRLSSTALDALGGSPLLAALECLTLSNDLGSSQQGLVARRLPRLRELRLDVNHTTAATLAGADWPNLTDLHLDFEAMAMSDDEEVQETNPEDVIAALVRAQGMPRLTRVVTSPLSPEDGAELARRFGTGFVTNEPR